MVSFSRPRFIIKNTSTLKVSLLGICPIKPTEIFDMYDQNLSVGTALTALIIKHLEPDGSLRADIKAGRIEVIAASREFTPSLTLDGGGGNIDSGTVTPESIGAEPAGSVSTHAGLRSGVHGISAYVATLIDDVDDAAARATLGLASVAASGSAADLSAGTLPAARLPALSGAVTTAVGTTVVSISASAIGTSELAALAVTDAKVAAANKDGLAATPSMRTLGNGATQAAAGNDARLSNSRSPTIHASNHKHGGSDEIASSTAAANAIPKAGPGAKLSADWLPAPVDNLTTSSSTDSLSAGQGKILQETKQKNITSGTLAPTGGIDGDIYLQYT